MVTPVTGTMTFRSLDGQRKYSAGIYFSDVVGAKVLFAPSGAPGSGSDQFIQLPEDVVLDDISIHTGNTVALGMYLTARGAPVPNTSVMTNSVLDTNAQRKVTPTGFKAGTNIGAVQF